MNARSLRRRVPAAYVFFCSRPLLQEVLGIMVGSEPDVIVVGGGPAGATVARDLAEGGLNVLLLDKDRFPRSKPCAGGLTCRAQKVLGLTLPATVVRERCRTFRAVLGDRVQELVFPEDYVVTVDRRDFDALLVTAAREKGVVVQEGEAVLSVEPRGNRVVVRIGRHQFSAPLVIGADGLPSRVAAALGGKSSVSAAPCVTADVPLPAGTPNPERWRGTIETHWGFFRWGYAWVFPKGDRLSVGMGSWDRRKVDLKRLWYSFVDSLGIPRVNPRGHLVPIGGCRRPRVGDGILLVGDAAGYADPLTGEGIYYALLSAHLAADTVLKLKAQALPYTAANLKRYERACSTAFDRDFRWALALNSLARRWPGVWQRAFFADPGWFNQALTVAQGERSYRQLALWSLARMPLVVAGSPTFRAAGIHG